jgi:hypothetical protein
LSDDAGKREISDRRDDHEAAAPGNDRAAGTSKALRYADQ